MINVQDIFMLPATGQTTSYRTGDDGNIRPGLLHAPRFTVVGNMVVDSHAGLLWVHDVPKIIPGGNGQAVPVARGVWSDSTNYVAGDLVQGDGTDDELLYIATRASINQSPPNTDYWVVTPWTSTADNLTTPANGVWTDAIDNCNALVYGGFSDWRLPNINELVSLVVHEGAVGTNYPPEFVMQAGSGEKYWSSTTSPTDNTKAEIVFPRTIVTSTAVKIAPAGPAYTRPVRSL